MVSNERRSVSPLLILVLLLIAALVIFLFVYRRKHADAASTAGDPASPTTSSVPLQRLEVPLPRPGDELVSHEGYTLGYRDDAEQAAWVAYVLTAAEVQAPNTRRSNNFRPDPLVHSGTATNADYEGSGYDRGHLAPAEDLSYSATAMSGSFFYSNMSPQLPAFNRGVWKRLEELVRFWATAYDSVRVVTGPVLEPGLRRIGPSGVAVPERYYKAVLLYGGGTARGIGFLLRNEPSAATLRSFAVSIDDVETATGLDLFPQLPDDIEARIESDPKVKEWRWTRK